MTIANDPIYQNRRSLGQAIASVDLILSLDNPPYFGWVILQHIKKHLVREYHRNR